MVINGTISSTGDIQIDGRIEGDVRSVGLVIGDKAEIHGEVLAEDVTVRGKVTGRIRARKVLLAATSHVEGDILHEAFAVESGAFFEGNCRHSDNPLGDDASRARSSCAATPGRRRCPPRRPLWSRRSARRDVSNRQIALLSRRSQRAGARHKRRPIPGLRLSRSACRRLPAPARPP